MQVSPVNISLAWIRRLILLVAVIIAIRYVSQMWPLIWSGLFLDYWNDYDVIAEAFQGRFSWARMVNLQSGDHMIVLPRLLFLADFWLAGGTNYLIAGTDILLMTGMVLLIYQAASRNCATTGILPALVLLLAVIHLFNHTNTLNILYSSNTQWFMAAFFSLAGLYIFTRVDAKPSISCDGLVLLCYLVGMLCIRAAWGLAPALALLLFCERRWSRGLMWAVIAASVHVVFMMSSEHQLKADWIIGMLLWGWSLFADMHTGFMAPSFGDTTALFSGRLLIIASLSACVHFTWRGRHRGDSGLRFAAGSILFSLLTIVGISISRGWISGLPQADRFQLNVQLSCLFVAMYWLLALPSVFCRGLLLALFTWKALAVNNLKYPEMQRLSAEVIAEQAEFMAGHANRDKQYPSGWGKDPLLFDAERLFASQTLAYYRRISYLVQEHQKVRQLLPCVWQQQMADNSRIVFVSTAAYEHYLPGYIVLLSTTGVPVGYGVATPQDEGARMDIWLRNPQAEYLSDYVLHGEAMQPCSLPISVQQKNVTKYF